MKAKSNAVLVVLACASIVAGSAVAGPLDPEDIPGSWTGTYKFYPAKKCTMDPCKGNVTMGIGLDISQAMPELFLATSFRMPDQIDHEVSFSAADCGPTSMKFRKWRGTLLMEVNRCRIATVTRRACETCLFGCGDGTCSHVCWEGASGCAVGCALIPFARWCGYTGVQEVCDQQIASESFDFRTKINKKVSRMRVKGKSPDGERVKMMLEKVPEPE